jgi:MSHA biogenesis protein MshK
MARRLIPTLLLMFAAGVVQAQNADPTRPAIDTGAVAASGAAPTETAAGLQSIIQRKNGRPAALINGAVVELGGKVGEARLVKIGDDHVVLRGALGSETLRLTPGIEKKAVRKEKK